MARFLPRAAQVAWTVDLSLDLSALLPIVGTSCDYSKVSEVDSFQRYTKLMHAIQDCPRGALPSRQLTAQPHLTCA